MDKKVVLGIIVGILFVLNICMITFKKKEYHIPLRIPKTAPKEIVDNKPQQELEKVPVFIDVPTVSNRFSGNSLYSDILNRDNKPMITDSRSTDAHEGTHGVNSRIRSQHSGSNGFYVTGGKGVVIKNPNMRKSKVAEFVPMSLRGSRFDLYISRSSDWDDMPTYILDEHIAYVNGGAVAVEDKKNGIKNSVQNYGFDAVSGSIEFSFYSIALAMAIEKYDSEYWKTNDQFRNYMNWVLKRAKEVYDSGKDIPEFSSTSQVKLEQNIKNSPDAEAMRVFIRKNFNGVWLDK